MSKLKILFSFLVLLIAGCASAPMTTEDIQNTRYSCSDVDDKISLLKSEKDENNKRILNGIRSVLPIGVIRGMIHGRYRENVKIATGEWANILDGEITEMEAFKKYC
jgi:hypothetical protein